MHVVGNVLQYMFVSTMARFFHCSPGMSCEVWTWLRSKIVTIMPKICWRSEIDRQRVLKEARRCQSVRKLLFPFARAPTKCRGEMAHLDRCRCTEASARVQQRPKVLRVRGSFGRAGEPTIVRQKNRALNKALWTHSRRASESGEE